MRKDLLLEIGTEEIPARFMPGILAQLTEAAKAKLAQLRLGYTAARTLGTPRRMTLIVEGIDEKQADISSENKGPSVKVAFDENGQPTKAGAGFARGQKVAVKDLVVKDGYVYAMVHEAGRPSAELLQSVVPELIHGLNFPKNMCWADLDMKFVRPIKWIVALLGENVISFSVAGVAAGNISRGHRFLSGGEVRIAAAAEYARVMEDNFVIVDPERRRSMIREQIERLAAEKGGRAEITADLLEEVVYLVEYPTALCGNFEDKYLNLPPEAVITPMREHQRYFPVKDAQGKLLPMFITVRNGGKDYLDVVQHGNERVLRARLADAQFFFEEDRKVALADRREKLKTVVFQEGLGTVYDKTERLQELAKFLLESAACEETEVLAAARRAAMLSKADLVTGMVCEFTELEGVMGREYALLDGEKPLTAQAIYEHYLPRFAGDALPESIAGRVLSIADKMDNIVATFSRGLVPTGSQDPYALRRQALGIVNILVDARWRISLRELAQKCMTLLEINDAAKREKIDADVAEFFLLRIKNLLADQKIRYDVVDAALFVDADDVYGACLRAKAVFAAVKAPEMAKSIQAFVRAGNLAKKADKAARVQPSLFNTAEEEALYKAYTSAAGAVDSLVQGEDYAGAVDALTDLAQPIDAFFDQVMVMDKDEAVKNNRLSLLQAITELTYKVADFSKIV